MTERASLLFVDDEPQILEGLRDLLRPKRRDWEVVTAPGGEAALALTRERSFDVIVADIRMPGMDGVELLARVRLEQPCAVRVVLSGQADHREVFRLVPVAHQFLRKPCEPISLRLTLERLLAHRRRLADPCLRELAGALANLPITVEARDVLRERLAAEPELDDALVLALESEPAIAAKLLQVTCSAFFGSRLAQLSVANGVKCVGRDVLAAIIEEIEVEIEDVPGLAAIRARSALAASIATALAPPRLEAEARAAASLHEAGALVALARAPGSSCDLDALSALGAYALALWGIPDRVVRAIAHQADPSRAPPDLRELAAVVHVASRLARCEPALEDAIELAGGASRVELARAGVSGLK